MTYPLRDRTPQGMLPGMIANHPAFMPDGTMRLQWCLDLQFELITEFSKFELITEFSKEEFQKTLYAGWYSTAELPDRHRWRQRVCLEKQEYILPRYGFEGSRRGVYASGICCNCSQELWTEKVASNAGWLEWLVNPDLQDLAGTPLTHSVMANWNFISPPKEGERPACGYEVSVTSPEDGKTIFEISRMQGVLAGAHQAMYSDVFPDLDAQHWFPVLGVDKSVEESLSRGGIVFHARTVDTGRIAGYISCSCAYGKSDAGDAGSDSKPHGRVNHVVVLDQHRGHGVGKMLFGELLDHLEQACPAVGANLWISVAERNARAKDWYERLGFAVDSEWKGYPGPVKSPVLFLNMQRRLDIDDFEAMFAV